ncbi:MAG: YceI family protein [Rhodanobacteraceae bacterium]|nr:YceI family protein [Rhodanobacteraceae bacterium]
MMRFAMIALLGAASSVHAKQWTVDASSTLGFSGTYQGEKFSGKFARFKAEISLDKAALADARLEVEIDVTSAATGNADYDAELKGSAFFDFAKFPKARFVSTAVRESGAALVADGTLTIRDKSKPIQLKLDFKPTGDTASLDVQATLKRLDFDVGTGDWADTSLIAADVTVSSHLVLK